MGTTWRVSVALCGQVSLLISNLCWKRLRTAVGLEDQCTLSNRLEVAGSGPYPLVNIKKTMEITIFNGLNKSTISMAIVNRFNSYVSHYQRVSTLIWKDHWIAAVAAPEDHLTVQPTGNIPDSSWGTGRSSGMRIGSMCTPRYSSWKAERNCVECRLVCSYISEYIFLK